MASADLQCSVLQILFHALPNADEAGNIPTDSYLWKKEAAENHHNGSSLHFRVKEETILNITINAKKMQISQSFTDYAQQKLDAKLDKFFGNEADAKLMLSELKGQIVLELTVRYNQMIYRAEQSAQDKKDALDAAIDKIIRQIRKNKTRLEKRLKDTAFKQEFQDTVEEQTDFNVIRRKTFTLRPMSVEEAILQMNMLGHNFFMFIDAATGDINVVYQREDEGYAVLAPKKD